MLKIKLPTKGHIRVKVGLKNTKLTKPSTYPKIPAKDIH